MIMISEKFQITLLLSDSDDNEENLFNLFVKWSSSYIHVNT